MIAANSAVLFEMRSARYEPPANKQAGRSKHQGYGQLRTLTGGAEAGGGGDRREAAATDDDLVADPDHLARQRVHRRGIRAADRDAAAAQAASQAGGGPGVDRKA